MLIPEFCSRPTMRLTPSLPVIIYKEKLWNAFD